MLLILRGQSGKGYIPCDSYYMTFWKKPSMETVKRLVIARGVRHEGGMKRPSTGDFLGEWNFPIWYYNDEYVSLSICQKQRMYKTKKCR